MIHSNRQTLKLYDCRQNLTRYYSITGVLFTLGDDD